MKAISAFITDREIFLADIQWLQNLDDHDGVRARFQENRGDVTRHDVVMDSILILDKRKGYPVWLFSPLVSDNVPGAEDAS